ncbi:MAG: glycosyltransferase family 1 protein [Streptosporangiales bacterium]|nr:glycosyltransferase family 1 protein [Streptosporangiales bacterium]MBO0891862.1 glycosyltransferase family 1 protein [Acidothermales bacterium]
MATWPVRIAFVTESWHPSTDGVVTRLSATVRELHRRGHDVLVIAPRGDAGDFAGAEVREVPTFRIGFVYGGRPWGLPLPRVARFLRDFRPDLVHVVNPVLLGIAGVWAAQRAGIPLVASYHTDVARYAGFYHLSNLQPLIRRVVGALHRRAVINLATSSQRCAELRAVGAPDVRLWRRGVDLDLFNPRHRTRPSHDNGARRRVNALYVGRLGQEKSIHRLAPLVEPTGRVDLTLVGDGPDRERLSERFASAPVTFAGTLHGAALAETYANADLFVFPSTTETLGLVLLEALASGVPVVTADTPASREMTGDCPACRLFPPDRPDRLTAAVDDLLASASPGQLAAAARAEAERWSWRAATDELLAHYADACATRHHGTRAAQSATAAAVPGYAAGQTARQSAIRDTPNGGST